MMEVWKSRWEPQISGGIFTWWLLISWVSRSTPQSNEWWTKRHTKHPKIKNMFSWCLVMLEIKWMNNEMYLVGMNTIKYHEVIDSATSRCDKERHGCCNCILQSSLFGNLTAAAAGHWSWWCTTILMTSHHDCFILFLLGFWFQTCFHLYWNYKFHLPYPPSVPVQVICSMNSY